jgi:hypothetical protein
MAVGDGVRRNIAYVDPSERTALRDAFIELNRRLYPGARTDSPPGGVSWWFKQDEVHQATHVHGGPEFLPWHREIVNRLELLLREINPDVSLHYWDWTQDPREIPDANLGNGQTGTLTLFTEDFMGYGGASLQNIGEPWLSAGYYVPDAVNYRSTDFVEIKNKVNANPADPPREVQRVVSGSPIPVSMDNEILGSEDYKTMRRGRSPDPFNPLSRGLEGAHDLMHGFVYMGPPHLSFRDPFVFLLHSNVDRLFARWQTDPAHPERLDPNAIYGSESDVGQWVNGRKQDLNSNIEPWSGGANTRPWAEPENEQSPKNYKDPSIVTPPAYDTNFTPNSVGTNHDAEGALVD